MRTVRASPVSELSGQSGEICVGVLETDFPQRDLKSVFEKVGIHSRRELLTTFNAPADAA